MLRAFAVLVLFAFPILSQQGPPAAPRDVLVKFKAPNPAAIQEIERDEDIELTKQVGGNGAILFRSRTKDAPGLIRKLSARPDVLYAEPNYILTADATSPNDPYFTNGSLWGMSKISAPAAWGLSTGTPLTVVAVVDTGIDYNHPDLAANVWSAPGGFTVKLSGNRTISCESGTHGFNAINETCDPLDDENHGTHVSGTIGAVGNNGLGVVGVNWTTKIMALKFLDKNGSGYTSDAVDAIEFAIQVKQTLGINIRVLSNSWGGGGYSQTLLDEINQANSNNMLFVVAAGNEHRNSDRTPSYPASYSAPNIVAVAATDSADRLASFSNYGATSVDLGAPGVGILSTIRNSSYASYSGTSMATPHVSGAAALVLSQSNCSSLTTAALKTDLLNSVDPVSSLAGKTVTGGRLNVWKALTSCGSSADFFLSVAPASQSVAAGKAANYTVSVTPVGGFSGAVTLGVTGLPPNATYSFAPQTISGGSGTSELKITATSRGTYNLTITGQGAGLTRTASVTLTVSKK